MTTPPRPTDHDGPLIPEVQDAIDGALRSARTVAASAPRHRAARRRPLLVAASTLATAAALAVVLVLVLAAAPSGGPIDVLSRARAALSPRGELIHYTVDVAFSREVSGSGPDVVVRRGACATPGRTEVWQTTRPDRWRTVAIDPPHMCRRDGTFRFDPDADRVETSWANGTSGRYVHREHRLTRTTGYPSNSSAGVPVGGSDFGHGDPIETIRGLLARGRLVDLGVRDRGGRSVRTLSGTRTVSSHGVTERQEFVYDVDPDSFTPIAITQVRSARPTDTSDRRGLRYQMLARRIGIRLDFRTYDRRPLDAAAERLLTITPPAGTRTVTRSVDDLRRQLATMRRAEERRIAERRREPTSARP